MEWETSDYWSWLRREGPTDRITGKYLFFSNDQMKLRRIAEKELSEHGFFIAKISVKSQGDYVLCLYWFDDSRKMELAKRHKDPAVKYRYWKSDEATRRGEYSEEFLSASQQRKLADERHIEEEFDEAMEDEDRPY